KRYFPSHHQIPRTPSTVFLVKTNSLQDFKFLSHKDFKLTLYIYRLSIRSSAKYASRDKSSPPKRTYKTTYAVFVRTTSTEPSF
ncbi:hypothetical protein GIB67_013727, partial [Kingdonia uniflora]